MMTRVDFFPPNHGSRQKIIADNRQTPSREISWTQIKHAFWKFCSNYGRVWRKISVRFAFNPFVSSMGLFRIEKKRIFFSVLTEYNLINKNYVWKFQVWPPTSSWTHIAHCLQCCRQWGWPSPPPSSRVVFWIQIRTNPMDPRINSTPDSGRTILFMFFIVQTDLVIFYLSTLLSLLSSRHLITYDLDFIHCQDF